jgi:hypothetical protein
MNTEEDLQSVVSALRVQLDEANAQLAAFRTQPRVFTEDAIHIALRKDNERLRAMLQALGAGAA